MQSPRDCGQGRREGMIKTGRYIDRYIFIITLLLLLLQSSFIHIIIIILLPLPLPIGWKSYVKVV
jgi:hypothetical protein